MGMLFAGVGIFSYSFGFCGRRVGGFGIYFVESGSGFFGFGGRGVGLSVGWRFVRGLRGWGCSFGGVGGCLGCFARRRTVDWSRRMRTSSSR